MRPSYTSNKEQHPPLYVHVLTVRAKLQQQAGAADGLCKGLLKHMAVGHASLQASVVVCMSAEIMASEGACVPVSCRCSHTAV